MNEFLIVTGALLNYYLLHSYLIMNWCYLNTVCAERDRLIALAAEDWVIFHSFVKGELQHGLLSKLTDWTKQASFTSFLKFLVHVFTQKEKKSRCPSMLSQDLTQSLTH